MTKRVFLIVFAITALATASQAQTKAELVDQLVELTYKSHPTISTQERKDTLPTNQEVEEITKENNADIINTALKSNKNLTPDQTAFVKANVDELGKMIDAKMAALRDKRYDFDKWTKDGLRTAFTAKYTSTELKTSISYFKSPAGKQTLNYIRLEVISRLMAAGPKANEYKVEYTPADESSYKRYVRTVAGKKFIGVFTNDVDKYMTEQMKEAFNAMWADTFAMLEDAEINKMIDKFVAEKYKK